MNFIQGEYVIMNTETSPATHGKKGIVLKTFDKDRKILVSIEGSKGYLVYPEQLFKIQRAPGFEVFIDQLKLNQYPAETAEEANDREQDELINKINAEKKLHNVAFNEGYDKGWQDAVNHFQGILKKSGY